MIRTTISLLTSHLSLSQLSIALLAIGFGLGFGNSLHADTVSETETLVSGIANYDAFDDQGGTRSLNFADIELDLEVDFHLPEITSFGGATNANLAIEMLFSWAPDFGHADPTDSGLQAATFNIPIVIASGATQPATTVTESVPLMSYTENTFVFDKPYGVHLLSVISSQVITGTFRSSGLGISATVSGDSTVRYDYTDLERVPEPTACFLSLLGVSLFSLRKRCV